MAKRKRKSGRKKKFKLFTTPSKSEEPSDPSTELWETFQMADYEDQITLCHQTIDEETLMDEEMAFEMFNTIFYKTVEHDERHRFEELAHKLQNNLPHIFDKEAHYILDWQITNALAEGRKDDVLPLAQKLAQTGGQYLDMFTRTLDQLDYHAQLHVLLEIMPTAWPDVKNSTGYFEWAVDEFAMRAVNYIVFDSLERNPALEASEPELQERIGFYLDDLNQEAFTNFLDLLTGRAEHQWKMSDFGFERQPRGKEKSKRPVKTAKLSDEAEQNLFELSTEFLRYLRHEEKIPYTKGKLARRQIYQYLQERHAGELEPQESMFEQMMQGSKKRKRKPKRRYPDHWLCPDRNTLDHFLANLLHFLSGRYYEAVVTFELTPAWLRFLESRKLIDAEQKNKTLQSLRGLDTELLKVFKGHADPALPRAIEQWRENQ